MLKLEKNMQFDIDMVKTIIEDYLCQKIDIVRNILLNYIFSLAPIVSYFLKETRYLKKKLNLKNYTIFNLKDGLKVSFN